MRVVRVVLVLRVPLTLLGVACVAYGMATGQRTFVDVGALVLPAAVGAGMVVGDTKESRTFGWPAAEIKRLYASFTPRCVPSEEGVRLVFHTYHGFLVLDFQSEHRFQLPPTLARELLWKFHCFNLKWGLFSFPPFGFLVPLVSFLNYLAQKRSISRQEKANVLRESALVDPTREAAVRGDSTATSVNCPSCQASISASDAVCPCCGQRREEASALTTAPAPQEGCPPLAADYLALQRKILRARLRKHTVLRGARFGAVIGLVVVALFIVIVVIVGAVAGSPPPTDPPPTDKGGRSDVVLVLGLAVVASLLMGLIGATAAWIVDVVNTTFARTK